MIKKNTFLQIRLTNHQKAAIKRAAKSQGLNVSAWVLQRLLVNTREQAINIIRRIDSGNHESFVYAELIDFLQKMTKQEFVEVFSESINLDMSPRNANFVAAMIEHAAAQKGTRAPDWLNDIEPLAEPFFATQLKSLRLYLLINSPIPYRKRNLFVDSSIGDIHDKYSSREKRSFSRTPRLLCALPFSWRRSCFSILSTRALTAISERPLINRFASMPAGLALGEGTVLPVFQKAPFASSESGHDQTSMCSHQIPSLFFLLH